MKNLIVLIVLLSFPIFAAEYGYHEGLSFGLGSGFDPADLTESRQECLVYDEERRMDGKGARGSSLDFNIVESKKDLYNRIGFSATASAQAYFVRGKAKTSYLDQFSFNENSLQIAIIGRVDYGRVQMRNPRLKPEYQQLINDGQFTIFSNLCGSHYVSEEVRSASVVAMISIHNISEKHIRKFDSSFGMSGGFGAYSGKLKTKIEAFLLEAAKESQINIKVFTMGGTGIISLKDMVKESEDINGTSQEVTKIRDTMVNYMNTMTVDHAVPVSFKTTSMSVFGWEDSAKSDYVGRDNILTEYYFLVSDLVDNHRQLQEFIAESNGEKYSHLSSNIVKILQTKNKEMRDEISRLSNEAQNCHRDLNNCFMPIHEKISVIFPVSLEEFKAMKRISHIKFLTQDPQESTESDIAECNRIQRQALRTGCISFDEYRAFYGLDIAPACTMKGQYFGAEPCPGLTDAPKYVVLRENGDKHCAFDKFPKVACAEERQQQNDHGFLSTLNLYEFRSDLNRCERSNEETVIPTTIGNGVTMPCGNGVVVRLGEVIGDKKEQHVRFLCPCEY